MKKTKSKKAKKALFKRGWVWLIAVILIGALFGNSEEPESTTQETQASTLISEEKPPSVESEIAQTPITEEADEECDEETRDKEQPVVSTPIPDTSTFTVYFFDVGQADAALVECDGHYMLIDGGNKEDSSLIYSVLKKDKINELDLIVATHAHEDHIGGLPGALNYAPAKTTLCPVTSYDSDAFADFAKYASSNGGGITIPSVGDKYKLGSAVVTILGVNGSSGTNNTSIILKITYGSTAVLFTGDAEREAEQAVLNSGADLSATVLKVGHHGSNTSTTYPFLREIMPTHAVISVGSGNSYGHPTDDTLSRLKDAGVSVYRTDLQGDICFTSDGTTVSVHAEKNTNADTLKPGTAPVVPPTLAPAPEPEPQQSIVAEEYDYVLNKNSKKIHYPSCSSVDQMSEKNKKFFVGTRDEAIAMGYEPCGNCHP